MLYTSLGYGAPYYPNHKFWGTLIHVPQPQDTRYPTSPTSGHSVNLCTSALDREHETIGVRWVGIWIGKFILLITKVITTNSLINYDIHYLFISWSSVPPQTKNYGIVSGLITQTP